MRYTVKKLAQFSGASVRTLHFYDEIGLLRPAAVGANGYRYYGEAELLRLQQIRFYRELGFGLRQIAEIVNAPDFDRLAALKSHRRQLLKRLADTRTLIATIDKTIKHLKGSKHMKTEELFDGFSQEQQARHEQYLVNRYGEGMRKQIAASRNRVKDWGRKEWERSKAEAEAIGKALLGAKQRRLPVHAPEVQKIIERHYRWICQFWTPNRESYTGFAELIVSSELRKPYSAGDPDLPEYTADAIRQYARTQLR